MQDKKSNIPYRLTICGEYMDCCYVNTFCDGCVITVSIKPTQEFAQRSGLSSGTRYVATTLWGKEIPEGDKNELAQQLFNTEVESFKFSVGPSDALGIVFPGCNKFHFNRCATWANSVMSITDKESLQFIKDHVFLIQLHPRCENFSVFDGPRLAPYPVNFIAQSAEMCWEAIIERNTEKLGEAFNMCYKAQTKIFPLMETDEIFETRNKLRNSVYGSKIVGAGGGGYLVIAADAPPENAIQIEPVGLD